MKRLLVICQKVDENDDHRGSFVDWLREFSRSFDDVSVIALAKGAYTLPANVHVYSLGKERGNPKILQAVRFYWYLVRLMPTSHGIFAHASPIFVVASWPFAFVLRKNIVLWYLHRANTFLLRLAVRLSRFIVTADAKSLTIQHPNIVAVGHGIDSKRFATHRDWSTIASGPLRIISVGRISSIKNYATLIRAAGLLRDQGKAVEVRIVGQSVMASDSEYEQDLTRLVQELRLEDAVRFVGFVAYRDMPAQYAWADIVVGCTPHGGIDKALLEGMAAGCIAFSSNDVMRDTLGRHADALIFEFGNPDDLAEKLQALSAFDEVSADMVSSVQNHHNLETTIGWISKLV